MERPCDVCGETYEARRATSKYCSTRCRTRASRGGAVVRLPAISEAAGGVALATSAALEAVGRVDSPLGQACLVLARRLDSPGVDTGSAVASVAGRLESMLATVTRGAGGLSAPQQLRDELAERRRKHA